ncbi:hypothetical protein [Nocardioides plantarum]|uniref:Uncharacterized protein n=1 Tax=Nocardioides plantarum TaxID=29299 RepID=A0ABV5KCU7_9ACTN|nr:hypothetical protein [Nocardioides plantarum]
MRLPVVAVVLALAWGATGCSDEPPPYEDGAQGVPLAGLGPELDAAGVDVVVADRPQDATSDQVVAAVEDAGVADVSAAAPDDDLPALAVDGGGTAGLLALVGPDPGAEKVTTVVLVFASPEAAAVYAAGDPEVFGDAALETRRTDLLSGNLAAYAVGTGSTTRVRQALEALAS